jgi:hypothetical protein
VTGAAAAWTLLLFVQAQGELAGHARRDLASLAAAARGEGSGLVLVEVDDGSGPPRRLRLGPAGPPEPAGAPGQAAQAVPSDPAGQAPATGATGVTGRLRDFLSWGAGLATEGPLVVGIWGHGRGWPQGVAVQADGDAIAPGALREALLDLSRRRGRPVDLLLFDACLMQQVEVLAGLAGAARYVVGTPQVQSFSGLPYPALLEALRQGPDAAARRLPDLGLVASRHLPPERANDELFFALGTADPAAVQARLVPALDALGGALDLALGADEELLAALRRLLRDAPGFRRGTRDVGALLALFEALGAPALRAPLADARAALSAAVLASAVGPQLDDREYSGAGAGAARALSVWAPDDREGYDEGAPAYASAPLHGPSSGWSRFLARLNGR